MGRFFVGSAEYTIPSPAGTETPTPFSVPKETLPAVTPSPSPDVDSVITPSLLPDTDSAIHNFVTDYVPNTVKRETIYLYERDNIPTVTKYYKIGFSTQDPKDFIPQYGIEEKDIAVMGFSAGGILCGEMLLNYDGLVNGSAFHHKAKWFAGKSVRCF